MDEKRFIDYLKKEKINADINDTDQTVNSDDIYYDKENTNKGEPDKVKDLIKEGADVNFMDEDGNTALHCAVKNCNLELIQLLLDKVKDINVKNNENKTPLNIAREINKQDIIEKIEDKILDTSLKMLENFKEESSSTDVNKNYSVKQDVERKIKEKINFCLNSLTELIRDTSQIKKFTHKNVNIFLLFLEAFALQDVEMNNNLSKDKKSKYIKEFFKEEDIKIIRDIRNIYMHRENKTENKSTDSIKDLILIPEDLENFVVPNISETYQNKIVDVEKLFCDLCNYVQGVYNKLENEQYEQSNQGETNQKGLEKILKSGFTFKKKYNTNETLLELFGNLVKEAYNSESEQQPEKVDNIMFNLTVNVIPLITKDFQDKLTELESLRDNLVHNFHDYESLDYRMILIKKAISNFKLTLFKYYFSEKVHNILIKIPRCENYQYVETKISEELKNFGKDLKERSFDFAEEDVNSLEYKLIKLLFKSEDNIKNKELIEELVDQYFKFMIIIDLTEIEGKEQVNNENEENTFLNQCEELSNVEKREIFEEFIHLEKIQEWPDEECKRIKTEKLKKKLAEYGINEDYFDEVANFYIEKKNGLDQKTEEQAKKVADIINTLINIQRLHQFSIRDIISLYEKRVFYSSDYEDIFRNYDSLKDIKLMIENKLNALPDRNEIIGISIADKNIKINIMRIVINVLKIFYNTYNKYQIGFNIEELYNDEVFLNYLVGRDVKRVNSESNQKPYYQFKNEDYIFMIIKKSVNIKFMAPYIACLLAKVQNTEVIEKDDLIKLLTILIKRDSCIPYLNELLYIKITEPGFCFYKEVYNILRNNEKENIDMKNMYAVFEKPEHVKGILLELLTSIEDESSNVAVEFMQKVLKLLNNVILDLVYQGKYKTSEEIVNLQEIELMQKALKNKYPKQDVDLIIVEYKLNAAKVKNCRGSEEKQQGKYEKAKELYKEALELLRGVPTTNSSQRLLIMSYKGCTKNLLKKYDEAYEEFENLYKELAKLTLGIDLNSAHGKDVYTKEICIQIAETKCYQRLLDLSSEYMKYLDVTSIGYNMAYSTMCSKNYDEALEIYKEIYNVVKKFKSRNKSTSWIVKKVAEANYYIANNKTDSNDDQGALEYYYDSLLEYNKALKMEKKKYGSYHPMIKSTYKCIHDILNSISSTHFKIGKLKSSDNTEEAIKHYVQALNIKSRIYDPFKTDIGKEDKYILEVIGYIACIYSELGKLKSLNNREEAVKHYEQALNIRRRIYDSLKSNTDEEDKPTFEALRYIGHISKLESSNNREEAVKHIEQALIISKKDDSLRSNIDDEDEPILEALSFITDIHIKLGELERSNNKEETIKHFKQALNINTHIYDYLRTNTTNGKVILKVLDEIVYVYIKLGKVEKLNNRNEAAKHFQQALGISRKMYSFLRSDISEENKHTLSMLNYIAIAHTKLGDLDLSNNREEAVKHYEEALNIRIRIYDLLRSNTNEELEHTEVLLDGIAYTSNQLGVLKLSSNKEESEKHYEEALSFNRRIYDLVRSNKGEKDERALKALKYVAFAYTNLGDLKSISNREAAVKQYEQALHINKRIYDSLKSNTSEEDDHILKVLHWIVHIYSKISNLQNDPKKALKYCDEWIDYNMKILNTCEKLFGKNSDQLKKSQQYLTKSKKKREWLLKQEQTTSRWR